MGNRRKVPLSEQQRLDKQSLHATYEQKRLLSADEYASWCRRQCISHGLQSNAQRSKVWLDILSYEDAAEGDPPSEGSGTIPYWSEPSADVGTSPSPANCHEHVMNCDISRSLWHVRDEQRDERRRQLKTVLMRCLLHHPELHYYQGLHELVGAVLSVVTDYLPFESQVRLVDLLVKRRWYIFCHASLKCSESLLAAVHHVIRAEDTSLGAILERTGVGPSTHYALPWVITWFTHHHADAEPVLCRLFDFLVGNSSPHAIVAVSAAVILAQRPLVMGLVDDDEEVTDEMAAYARAYTALAKLPNSLLEPMSSRGLSDSGGDDGRVEVEAIVQEAQRLLERHGLRIKEEIAAFQSAAPQGGEAKKGKSALGLVRSVSMMLLVTTIGVANYLVITGTAAS